MGLTINKQQFSKLNRIIKKFTKRLTPLNSFKHIHDIELLVTNYELFILFTDDHRFALIPNILALSNVLDRRNKIIIFIIYNIFKKN